MPGGGLMSQGIEVKIEFPDLPQLKKGFQTLRASIAKRSIGAALKRAMQPAVQALQKTTPKGPTGNLRKAIFATTKTYKSGNVVGLIGYRKAGTGKTSTNAGGTVRKGKDFAYHQGLVEFGSKNKRVTKKGNIASSYNRLGNFKIKKPSSRGQFAGSNRVETTPKYPKAFFKRAPSGQSADLGDMPIGGSSGDPPVRTAYRMSKSRIQSLLPTEMTKALNNAMAQQFRFLNKKAP
jgi:hypothetical protein